MERFELLLLALEEAKSHRTTSLVFAEEFAC
jgi:hypothetical protein